MDRNVRRKWINIIWQAAKIGAGSSAAIFVATQLNLQFSASAGTIALLTLMTTRWETLRLSVYRIITYGLCVGLSALIFMHVNESWMGYGLYILFMILMCEALGWKSTISVNSVIGVHFMQTHDFSLQFIYNEFMLVFIGITIAIVLNLFHLNRSYKKDLIKNMRYTEEKLQLILRELAAYLHKEEEPGTISVWDEISDLEQKLQVFAGEAYEYQGNTFSKHHEYYIDYFEMRHQQLGLLHSLHHEVDRLRTQPEQANIIAEYMFYLKDYVVEVNAPDEQIARLKELLEGFRVQPLPKDRDEFESRAILYHILMDIEDFLLFKKRFVDELDDHKLKKYWKHDRNVIKKQEEHAHEIEQKKEARKHETMGRQDS